MPNFARTHVIDLFVLTWFIACWAGYAHFAKRKARRTASLVVAMRLYRREWFRRVLQHENRIADIAAFNSLLTSATFFASTAILILGGLVAMLGTTDRVVDVVAELPFARSESERFSRVKIFLVIGVFVVGMLRVVIRPEWIEMVAGRPTRRSVSVCLIWAGNANCASSLAPSRSLPPNSYLGTMARGVAIQPVRPSKLLTLTPRSGYSGKLM